MHDTKADVLSLHAESCMGDVNRPAYLEACAVLTESCLHLQLLLNGSIGQLCPLPFHLCGSPEGALQPSGLILHILQFPLEPIKLWLTLVISTEVPSRLNATHSSLLAGHSSLCRSLRLSKVRYVAF